MNHDHCPILIIPGTPPPFQGDNSQIGPSALQDFSLHSPALRVWPSSPSGSSPPLQDHYFIDMDDIGINGYSAEQILDKDWSASYGQASQPSNTVYSAAFLTPSPISPTSSLNSMSPLSRMLDTFSFDENSTSPILSNEFDLDDEQDVAIAFDASIHQRDFVQDELLFSNPGSTDNYLEALFPPEFTPDDFLQTFEDSANLTSLPQTSRASTSINNHLNSPSIQISPTRLPYFVDVDYSAGGETLCSRTDRIVSSTSTASSLQHTRSLSSSSDVSALSSSSRSPVSPYSHLSPASPTDLLLSPTDPRVVSRNDGLQRRHSHSNGSDPSSDHHAQLRRTRSSTTVRNHSPYARPQKLPQTYDSLVVPSPIYRIDTDQTILSSASGSQSSSREATVASDDQLEDSTTSYDLFRDTIASDAVLLASARRRKKPANFECPICSQLLTSKDNLNNHLDAHRGIRRHKCKHCLESFRTRSVLKRHQKSIKCPGSQRSKDV